MIDVSNIEIVDYITNPKGDVCRSFEEEEKKCHAFLEERMSDSRVTIKILWRGGSLTYLPGIRSCEWEDHKLLSVNNGNVQVLSDERIVGVKFLINHIPY